MTERNTPGARSVSQYTDAGFLIRYADVCNCSESVAFGSCNFENLAKQKGVKDTRLNLFLCCFHHKKCNCRVSGLKCGPSEKVVVPLLIFQDAPQHLELDVRKFEACCLDARQYGDEYCDLYLERRPMASSERHDKTKLGTLHRNGRWENVLGLRSAVQCICLLPI